MSKTIDVKSLKPLPQEVQKIMNTEFGIGLKLGIVYFIYALAVPILTFTAPEFMRTRIWGGMSLTWFLTAIGAMFMAVLIAWLHVHFYQKQFSDSATEFDKNMKGGPAH